MPKRTQNVSCYEVISKYIGLFSLCHIQKTALKPHAETSTLTERQQNGSFHDPKDNLVKLTLGVIVPEFLARNS